MPPLPHCLPWSGTQPRWTGRAKMSVPRLQRRKPRLQEVTFPRSYRGSETELDLSQSFQTLGQGFSALPRAWPLLLGSLQKLPQSAELVI